MGTPDDPSARLEELERRIRAAREASRPQSRRRPETKGLSAADLAWRMTIELVAGMLIGAAMGWGLDGVFGTRPLFLVIFVLLGVAAGMRTAMRSAEEMRRKDAARAEEERAEEKRAATESAADGAENGAGRQVRH